MAGMRLPGETIAEANARLGFQINKAPTPKRHGEEQNPARVAAWLASEPFWSTESRLGAMGTEKEWVGVKILGIGGNGTAGLWNLREERPPEGTPDRIPFKSVVVKQQYGDWGDMKDEARIYELLRHVDSPHLVKMYRKLYKDKGLGTVPADRRGDVRRIFLEVCEGGDLDNLIHTQFRAKDRFEEHKIWNIFHCLARALYALHYGHEELGRERWDRDEIVHFDLKPQNVFVGSETRDEEHKGENIMKIGDYGQTTEVPVEQDSRYQYKYRWIGTQWYKLPEQLRRRNDEIERPWMDPPPKTMYKAGEGNVLTSTRYGTHSNVWQIGLIMWHCIHSTEYKNPVESVDSEIDMKSEDLHYFSTPLFKWPKDRDKYDPPERFDLNLYKIPNTWLGANPQAGGVHTLAMQEDMDWFDGKLGPLPDEPEANNDPRLDEEEKKMNRIRRLAENMKREWLRDQRVYSDHLHRLVMDCLIVQHEGRIHVENLYRQTLKVKKFYASQIPPVMPPPYNPEPPLAHGELPHPWSDVNRIPGEGLGVPVQEGMKSQDLPLFDLFRATSDYEKALEVIRKAEEGAGATTEKATLGQENEARALIKRTTGISHGLYDLKKKWQGQRERPVPRLQYPFPKGFLYDHREEAAGGQAAGGKGKGKGKKGKDLSQEETPSKKKERPVSPRKPRRAIKGADSGELSAVEEEEEEDERPTHNEGNPKGPGDLSINADSSGPPPGLSKFESTPDSMRAQGHPSRRYSSGTPTDLNRFESTPEHMRGKNHPSKRGYGDEGSEEEELEDIGGGIKIRRVKPQPQKDQPDRSQWPVFPIGLQKEEIDQKVLARALAIPELKDTIMFCTVIDRSKGWEQMKGVIYLTGLLPTTTVRQIKEMLTEKDTGIAVENMKLMGNGQLNVFREFEDHEQRSAIFQPELYVSDITQKL